MVIGSDCADGLGRFVIGGNAKVLAGVEVAVAVAVVAVGVDAEVSAATTCLLGSSDVLVATK
jgi:hypothetical protein